MGSESAYERARRVASMIAAGEVTPLLFALWIRWRRLEFRCANEVPGSDGYAHSGGPTLGRAIRSLSVPSGAVAIDIGVGMGIAAYTLSQHFARVIGVELSPTLIAAAHRNLGRLKVTNVQLHCADARGFVTGLDDVTHVYMFNPFPEAVMSDVLANINESRSRKPRDLMIIYKHPVCHSTILKAGFLHVQDIKFPHSHPFAIYKTPTAAHISPPVVPPDSSI